MMTSSTTRPIHDDEREIIARWMRDDDELDYGADLRGGEVRVARYRASRAMRVDPARVYKDEYLPAFFLEVGAKKLLYLRGEYLIDPVDAGQFPCAEFEIVWLPNAEEVLCVNCLGAPIAAENARERKYLYSEAMPEPGTLFEGKFDELEWLLSTENKEQRMRILRAMRKRLPRGIAKELRPMYARAMYSSLHCCPR